MGYVLVETLASEQQGRTLWYAGMTDIGPMTTDDPAQRAEFPTRELAAWSPAMFHALSFFEVEELASEPTRDEERAG